MPGQPEQGTRTDASKHNEGDDEEQLPAYKTTDPMTVSPPSQTTETNVTANVQQPS